MSPKDNLERLLKGTNYSEKMPYVDREPTFRAMCEFVKARQHSLDTAGKKDQVVIFETGCVRSFEDFGAGYSTVIFDTLLQMMGKGYLTSVDITKQNVKIAKGLIKWKGSEVLCDDSLNALGRWSTPIDLLYLDSFDLALNDDTPSAEHHLKELKLALPLLRRPAMVAVDDNFSGEYRPKGHRYKGSKGRLIRDYLTDLGLKPVLDLQQTVWLLPPNS
jgi:hypothetical protein